MRELKLDWRGTPDLTANVEAYSIAATAESRPTLGNPDGKLFVAISPTIMYAPDGTVAARPYNLALYDAAVRLGALMPGRTIWTGNGGYRIDLFDLTKRGMLQAWLKLIDQFFPWADGIHIDWFTAWSWKFPDMAPTDDRWDYLLHQLANSLRYRGLLVIGQQYHLTNPLMACNGAFVEQSPFAWRYTLAKHAAEMEEWWSFVNRVDPRPDFWVYEIREYLTWPVETLDLVKQWAEEQNVLLCLGRK